MTKLLLLLLFAPLLAHADPAFNSKCEPAPDGTGTYRVPGRVEGLGEWHYYFCPTMFSWRLTIIVKRDDYKLIHPPVEDLVGKDRSEIVGMYMRLNAQTPCTHPSVKPLCDAAQADAINHWPPRFRYTVPLNGGETTRPAFGYTAAGRLKLSSARIPVNTECDTTLNFVEGTTVYARVAPGLVAVCRRVDL